MAKKEDTDILADLEKKLGKLEQVESGLDVKKKELKEMEDKIADAYSSQMEIADELEDLKKKVENLKKEEKTLKEEGIEFFKIPMPTPPDTDA